MGHRGIAPPRAAVPFRARGGRARGAASARDGCEGGGGRARRRPLRPVAARRRRCGPLAATPCRRIAARSRSRHRSFAWDGALIAAIGEYATRAVWNVGSGERSAVPRGPLGKRRERRVLSGRPARRDRRGRRASPERPASGPPTATLASDGDAPGLDFSPDGRLVAATGLDGRTARLGRAAMRRSYARSPPAPRLITIRFSPDGKLARGRDDRAASYSGTRRRGSRKVGRRSAAQNGWVVSVVVRPDRARRSSRHERRRQAPPVGLAARQARRRRRSRSGRDGRGTGSSPTAGTSSRRSGSGLGVGMGRRSRRVGGARVPRRDDRELTRAEWRDLLPDGRTGTFALRGRLRDDAAQGVREDRVLLGGADADADRARRTEPAGGPHNHAFAQQGLRRAAARPRRPRRRRSCRPPARRAPGPGRAARASTAGRLAMFSARRRASSGASSRLASAASWAGVVTSKARRTLPIAVISSAGDRCGSRRAGRQGRRSSRTSAARATFRPS